MEAYDILVNNLVDRAFINNFYIVFKHLQFSSVGSFIYDIVRLSYLIPIGLSRN